MKFQSSAIAATSMSGKSGGTVATINGQFKRKANNGRQRSSGQTKVRAIMTYLATLWGTLTEAQQNSWIIAAPNFVRMKNGEAKKQTGIDLFIRTNMPLAMDGQPVILEFTAPGELPVPPGPQSWEVYIEPDPEYPPVTLSKVAFWATNPREEWTWNWKWTGWQKTSRHYFPKPTKILNIDTTISNAEYVYIFFGGPNAVNEGPWALGLKTMILEQYINKVTGQVYTIGTKIITAEDSYERYNPVNAFMARTNVTWNVVGDDVFVDITFENQGDPFEWSQWEPYIVYRAWQEGNITESIPLTLIFPESEIEIISATEAVLHFGPDAGMPPGPGFGVWENEISFSLRNTVDGSIIGQNAWGSQTNATAP